MGKKFIWLVILAIISVPFLSNPGVFAQATPKKGGTLNVGLNTDIVSVDPHTASADVNSFVFHHVFEPIIAFSEDFQLRPCLAEKWEASPDFKVITFYLHKGRLFHNGREMVADDVKYSIERIMKLSPRRKSLENISRVEVVDKYTVRLHMNQADVSPLFVLGGTSPIMGILPKEEVDKQGGKFSHPIGTGPFKFVEWKPDRYVLLERFDQYKPLPGKATGYAGGRIVYLDKVRFIPIPEESAAMMALLNKEIDFLQYVPFKDVERLQKDYSKRGIVVDSVPGESAFFIYFGCRQPITNNVKFRQACAYAIDLEVVMQAAIRGYGVVNPSLVSIKNQYYTPAHKKWYRKDINKAKQLLQEAGYKGEEIEFLTDKKYAQHYSIAVAVQSELAAAGVNVKLNVVEWNLHLQKHFKGEFQINVIGHGPRPDPVINYKALDVTGFLAQYPRMGEILAEASKTMDLEKRRKLFEEAQALVYEGVPTIYFYNRNYINAYWDYVKGYENWLHQARFWGVWLSK